MKYKGFIIAITLIIVPMRVYANSSWHWISETRPFDILPWVALGTILIEWLMIWKIPKLDKGLKVLGVVIASNLASFLLPYMIMWFESSWYGSFQYILNSGPHYIVGIIFLILTCSVEIPLIYLFFQKKTENPTLLIKVILLANVITTIGVAIVEHVLTKGAWA